MPTDTPETAPERESTYFGYYGMLMHQQNMLQDHIRTATYHDAITSNKADFKGKVVLDVGAGTGILSFFAVKAGAARVYAVEASDMAKHARRLVEGNGLGHIITVIQGKVEDIELPEKVDVIISEPMGVLLVHERMMESLIVARDRFLKQPITGALPSQIFPSSSFIYLAPFTDMALYSDAINKVSFWNSRDFYGLDLSPLLEAAGTSQFAQSIVGPVDPRTLLASPVAHGFQFATMNVKEFRTVHIPLRFVASSTGIIHGLAGWFDVLFAGTDCLKQLSTSPSHETTHWYQCRFVLSRPIAVNQGQVITGSFLMTANDQRSHDISLQLHLEGTDIKVDQKFALQDQQYWNLAGPQTQAMPKDALGVYNDIF